MTEIKRFFKELFSDESISTEKCRHDWHENKLGYGLVSHYSKHRMCSKCNTQQSFLVKWGFNEWRTHAVGRRIGDTDKYAIEEWHFFFDKCYDKEKGLLYKTRERKELDEVFNRPL